MASNVKYEVEITLNDKAWANRNFEQVMAAAFNMGKSIMKNAQVRTPRKNNYLVNTADVKRKSNVIIVSFGNSKIKYAAYQERGERLDGSHKVQYYTTPETGKNFLKTAGIAGVRKGLRCYRFQS